MRYRFVEAYRLVYRVGVMCRVLEVSRSGYYVWRRRRESPRTRENRVLGEHIRSIHAASRGTYGAPRIHAELHAQGRGCGRHRVARLMRVQGIFGIKRRQYRRTTAASHGRAGVAENLLGRRFDVTRPNTVWAGDLTCIWTGSGWLHLAVVLDLYARRVVGWAMGGRHTEQLVIDALTMAVHHRKPKAGLLHHSDQGSQYAAEGFQRLLKAQGLVCSMSRKGNCYDNAVVESFFSTLKTELLRRYRYVTREAARAAIFEYIEVFYNRLRRHSTLGYCSPADYEQGVHLA